MLKLVSYLLGAVVLIGIGGFFFVGLTDTQVPQEEIIIDINAERFE